MKLQFKDILSYTLTPMKLISIAPVAMPYDIEWWSCWFEPSDLQCPTFGVSKRHYSEMPDYYLVEISSISSPTSTSESSSSSPNSQRRTLTGRNSSR
jgi:hypothetical protein